MSMFSDYMEGEILKHLLRTGSWTKPTVVAVALCTAATTDANTGATITEVANSNSYARVQNNPADGNWAAPGVGGLSDNVGAITFTAASGSWGTVSYIALVDSATWGAGNSLLHGALTASKTVGSGDVFKFNAGDLDVTVA